MINHPKFPKGNIYLSGGMEFAKNNGEDWRAICSEELKKNGYYPFDIAGLDKAYANVHGNFYGNFAPNEEGMLRRKAIIRKQFIHTDLNLIVDDTDAMIVLYDESVRRGAGTISECQVAFLHDIPIFIVSAWEDWEKEIPGWLHGLSTKIFTSFDDLHKYLADLPEGILKRDIYGNHSSGNMYLCSLSGEPFEKTKTHFVSNVSPLYSKQAVKIVMEVNEDMKDRYQFFTEYLEEEVTRELCDD